MKKLVAILTVLCAAQVVRAEDSYRYDRDFDGVDDLFDECPAVYAYTLSGCPGGLPDNREVTCEGTLKVKPGLYATSGRVVIPLNRKFCWGDQEKVFIMQSGGALILGIPLQRVPGLVELWSATFTIGEQTVWARAEGAPSGKKFGFAVAVTGFRHPVVSWDLEKQSLVVTERSQSVPFAVEGTSVWGSAVASEAIEAFLAPRRHHFEVTSAEVVEEKARVGVRFTTTSPEILIPADIRVGAPDIALKLGHYFLYWRSAVPHISIRSERRAPNVHQAGKLEVTFLRASCAFDQVTWSGADQGLFSIPGRVEDSPAPRTVVREDRCTVILPACAETEIGPEIDASEEGTLTVWLPLRRESNPHL